MADSHFIIAEITDPELAEAASAQLARGRRNLEWLGAHWAELLPGARGRFVAVAGLEGHVADTAAAAWAWADATHPEDNGAIVQYVRPEQGPRIYAYRGTMASVR